MSNADTCIVIGGGVAGLWTAWALADSGIDVTLLDAGKVGSGASWGNAGWICPAQTGPLPEPGLILHGIKDLAKQDSALHFTPSALLRMGPWIAQFARYCNQRAYDKGVQALTTLGYPSFKLIEQLGLDKHCDKTGVLAVAKRRIDVEHFVERLTLLTALGQELPGEILSGDAVQDAEPVIGRGQSAVLIKSHWQIVPDRFTAALAEEVRRAGVTIVEHQRVSSFDAHHGIVHAVRTAEGAHAADYVVIAAGAQTADLTRQLGYPMPLIGGKGYSIDVVPTRMPKQAVMGLDTHTAVSPMGEQMRIAGIMEFSTSPETIAKPRVDALKRSAANLVGSWTKESVPWTGLRPVAPDGMPLIGRLAPASNAFVATGYSMLGMTISPAAGTYLARSIIDGDDGATGPFSPQRFRKRYIQM